MYEFLKRGKFVLTELSVLKGPTFYHQGTPGYKQWKLHMEVSHT